MHKLVNPIIQGFYPDPTICRVGDDYYIACSSFELVPGIPIFHSKDLANWEQIGYAMTLENGLHLEKNGMVGGIMAPTLRYHDGTFYIMNTNFCDKGNYIITAKNPAGPWSKPHWLKDVPGIDASFFFDHDGQCYVMGTGNVWDNGAGQKERGIWLAKFDIENFCMAGEPVTIFNSALRGAASPEAPHLYHIGSYYYLVIAEGGTEHYHSVVVARSHELFGFYEGNPANPVMTHRHMGYKAPIINVGHADLVELPDGSWYAVMLASRLIDETGKNLGRETFICPVVWERDWPLFSPETGKIEWSYEAPSCLPWTPVEPEIERDDFEEEKLNFCWSFWGTPYEKFYEIKDSRLYLKCISQTLTDDIKAMGFQPKFLKDQFASFVARRQKKIHTVAACQMSFVPRGEETAGIAVIQAMNHQYHLERALENGRQVIRVVLYTSDYEVPPYFPGFTSVTRRYVVAETTWDKEDIVLSMDLNGECFTMSYGSSMDRLQTLCSVDGNMINPEKVGCMSGTMIGMYATGNGKKADNEAKFDWFELK